MDDREQGRAAGAAAEHLRGKDGRSAEDTRQGNPRPDEAPAGSPPGIQATHAGRPTNDPAPERHEDTSAGLDSVPMGDHGTAGRSRYTGHGRDTEGAFGEEQGTVDRP